MLPTLILETTAYTLDQLQQQTMPQIALAGRSNVGKSSLINALANRKKLARISSTPGKTRSVNYYRAEPYMFYLVDLPGYGYARCSREEQEKWSLLIEHYITHTPALKGLVLLLDCRLSPQKSDLALAAFARSHGLRLLPVLTKADKCTRNEQAARQKEWAAFLPCPPILSSSLKKTGIEAIWKQLADLNAEAEPAPKTTE